MNDDTRAAVRRSVADTLLALLPRPGLSSRETALAVAICRLDYGDDALRALVAEVGDHVPRLRDLVGALSRWRTVDPRMTINEWYALHVAELLVALEAAEVDWAARAGHKPIIVPEPVRELDREQVVIADASER